MRGFRTVFLRMRRFVCLVMLRGIRALGQSRDRGSDGEAKQDEECPRMSRKFSKKAETIERPGRAPDRQNKSKKLHISMNLAVYGAKTKWRDKYLSLLIDLSATAGPVYHLISCSDIVTSEHDPGAMASSKIERAALEPWQPC